MNFGRLLDFLFPRLCLSCQKSVGENEAICENCFKAIPVFKTLSCPTCRARLPDLKKICHVQNVFRLYAACDYENLAVKSMVQSLKFKGARNVAGALAKLITDNLPPYLPLQNSILIPIPLGRSRLRSRGYNQSLLLAQNISSRINIPWEEGLVRLKETKPQSSLDRKERQENVTGCFALAPGFEARGRRIFIVDDVLTSGATMNEAARTLKAAGGRQIIALTAART